MSTSIHVLFLASEAEPFVKVGGLADVAGSLPLALRSLPPQATHDVKLDVRLVLPLHRTNRDESTTMHPVAEFSVHRMGGRIPTQVFATTLNGMPVYFISGDPLTRASGVYSIEPAPDRDKYSYFSLAALELRRHLDWRVDILHANDWHTALALYALRMGKQPAGANRIRTIMTLHNLPYMGGEAAGTLETYGLKPLQDGNLPTWARSHLLPLGLWASDAIIPVSPTYAREILTPEYGCGLEEYLRSRSDSITGILNGLDVNQIDPNQDESLPMRFSAETLGGRLLNKTTLQKTMGLAEDSRIPILAMVGRIDRQKGLDLAFEALRQTLPQRWQFVLLGTGDPVLENQALRLQEENPERIRVAIRYDAPLGRLIYSGADIFLMPSRYEPCGLAQMHAMRYGCVPIVRATGGLKDTVEEGRTGFLFEKEEASELAEAIGNALRAYSNPTKWERYQRNGMNMDFSWSRSARQYAIIYRALISDKDEVLEAAK